MTDVAPADAHADDVRASQMIAVALIERQTAHQIVDRATKCGMKSEMIETVVSVCCGQQKPVQLQGHVEVAQP